ncbi:MAG: hypothetical protein AABY68_12005 [Pseudomonadota bacterium]
MIPIARYPQLRLITWNRRADEPLDDDEAYAIYTRNWRFVDTAHLQQDEMNLLHRLAKKFNAPHLHV